MPGDSDARGRLPALDLAYRDPTPFSHCFGAVRIIRLPASIRGPCGGSYGLGMGPKTACIRIERWVNGVRSADTRDAEPG